MSPRGPGLNAEESRSSTPLTSVSISNTNSINSTSQNPPSQLIDTRKRRRVTRACDECRKKKVKCDGKQPCIHCTVYSYNCTYQSPNSRNKKSAIMPEKQNLSMLASAVGAGAAFKWDPYFQQSGSESVYKNIVKLLLPKINLDEENSGMKLEKVYTQLSKIKLPITTQDVYALYNSDGFDASATGITTNSGTGSTPTSLSSRERQLSISSMDDSVNGSHSNEKMMLPTKEVALKLIYTTWNEACVLFRFYHRPSLLEEVDLLYSIDPANYTDRQHKFLPFMYSILATGCLFSKLMKEAKTSEEDGKPNTNKLLDDDGFKYFLAARNFIDFTNIGDIITIQTVVMMVIYLQCSARLSTCYAYIGIALRSALKEGLHRNLSIFQGSKKNKLTPIEIDTRQRLFYTIYKMDIYINSLLGLPRSINEDEFDQEFPIELDDENITLEGFNVEAQGGRLSSAGCANHHTRLLLIISHIVKDLYPIKLHRSNSPAPDKMTPEYTHSKVTEIEYELKTWLDNLPMELKPTDPNVADSNRQIPKRFMLANCYLHLSFLNCQIMLYRPFIHFISNGSINKKVDPRSLIRGRNCIKVARMVVKLANKMIDQDLLIGTYWFSMYTIFFSIACLIYYFHFANYANNNSMGAGVNYAGVFFDDDLNIEMIQKDIEIGKKVLDCLKNSSTSSLRIFNILKNLFEQLNRRTASSSSHGAIGFSSDSDNSEKQSTGKNQETNKTVLSTFMNFDSMNNFTVPSENSFNPSFEQQIPQFDDMRKQQSPLGQLHNTVKLELNHDESLLGEIRTIDNNEIIDQTPIGTSGPQSSDPEYIPGVFDKLDAQIFGRILPPYMLEKNAKLTAAVNDINSNTSNAIDTGQNHRLAVSLDGDFGSVNFDDLEKLMFDNTIDQLDPFNTFYDQVPPSNP